MGGLYADRDAFLNREYQPLSDERCPPVRHPEVRERRYAAERNVTQRTSAEQSPHLLSHSGIIERLAAYIGAWFWQRDSKDSGVSGPLQVQWPPPRVAYKEMQLDVSTCKHSKRQRKHLRYLEQILPVEECVPICVKSSHLRSRPAISTTLEAVHKVAPGQIKSS